MTTYLKKSMQSIKPLPEAYQAKYLLTGTKVCAACYHDIVGTNFVIARIDTYMADAGTTLVVCMQCYIERGGDGNGEPKEPNSTNSTNIFNGPNKTHPLLGVNKVDPEIMEKFKLLLDKNASPNVAANKAALTIDRGCNIHAAKKERQD